MSGPRVALLGAPGTGKDALARGLREAVQAHGLTLEVIEAEALEQALAQGASDAQAGALLAAALQGAQACQATLLAGLDLPLPADACGRNEQAVREHVDARLRTLLQQAGIAFQVVYGSGTQRLPAALAALVARGLVPATLTRRTAQDDERRAWAWLCEKCSDPACEHRLFTQLREQRGRPP